MDEGLEFKLTVLGSGSAMPIPQRYQSAHVLTVHGRSYLIDCGEGAQRQMIRYHIPFSRIDAIFISHIHGDHVFGLFGLLSTMALSGRTAPLDIYGPVALGPVLNFNKSFFGDFLSFEVRFSPLKYNSPSGDLAEPFLIRSTKALEVWAMPLNHGIDTFGYIFKEREPQMNVRRSAIEKYGLTLTEIGTLKRGEDVVREDGTPLPASEISYRPYSPRSYAYVSDTAYFDKEAQWLRGVKLLYHEATYAEEFAQKALERFHSTTLQAAAVARDSHADTLLIGHFSSSCKDPEVYEAQARTIFPNTFALSDGQEFSVPLDRVKLD